LKYKPRTTIHGSCQKEIKTLLDGKDLLELNSLLADVSKTVHEGKRSDSEYWSVLSSELQYEIAKKKFQEEYSIVSRIGIIYLVITFYIRLLLKVTVTEQEIIEEIRSRHDIAPIVSGSASAFVSGSAESEENADGVVDQELEDEEKMKSSDEITLPMTKYLWYSSILLPILKMSLHY